MPDPHSSNLYGSMTEPHANFKGPHAEVNRRLCEVIRQCGELHFQDIVIRPVLFHVISPDKGANAGTHRHPFTELTWVEGSAVNYQQGGRRIRINAGGLFFMPALTVHSWQAPTAGSTLHGFMLSVQPTTIRDPRPAFDLDAIAAASGYRLAPHPELTGVLKAMERHALAGTTGATTIAAGYMRTALGLVFQRIAQAQALSKPAAMTSSTPKPDWAFVHARDFILANLHRNPSLPDVAAHVGITPRHLNRLFAARLGLPAGAFMLHTRIDRARHLLHEPGARVKLVASDCGFTDPAYFCRAFRRQVGQTPAAYARST